MDADATLTWRERQPCWCRCLSPNLLRRCSLSSFTMVFWAQSQDSAGLKSISLAGIDSHDNVCFHIDGLEARILPVRSRLSALPSHHCPAASSLATHLLAVNPEVT